MLKRTTPIIRRVPLKRGGPIRRVSKRRAKQLREYSASRPDFLRRHPICHVWLKENGWIEAEGGFMREGQVPRLFTATDLTHSIEIQAPLATEIHHKNKRRGAMLNDERHWLAVCRENHERIEQNKSWARANGFLENF